jgi:hypothetical protein
LSFAAGCLLNEIRNDITRETPASFEPTIDYVVVKVPRFAFEEFPQAVVAAFGRKPPSEKPGPVYGALPRRRYG